jgi:hypothetical protein
MPKGKTKTPIRAHEVTLRELEEAGISAEEREEMIAEAAYYRALSRGFEGDEHLRDWFEAEKIVDAMLHKAATKQADISH